MPDRLLEGCLSVRADEGKVQKPWSIAGGEAGEQTYAAAAVDGEVVGLAELGFDATT